MPEYHAKPPFDDGMTLAEARAILRTLADRGVDCPLCSQHVKKYRRRITSSATKRLIRAYLRFRLEPFHGPSQLDTSNLGGEWARLAYWELIADLGVEREDGGRAGWWRVTTTGERFLAGELRVPKYQVVYGRTPLYPAGDPVGVEDALGHRFDLRELMRRDAPERAG